MARAPARARLQSFAEVARGYSEWQAVAEANRCLECPTAPCGDRCPLGLDVGRFVSQVAQGEFDAAFDTLTDACPLPGICSRLCKQETHCEGGCVRPGEPVAVGRLERFVAEWGAERGRVGRRQKPLVTAEPHAVAIVGSGPAGLVAAADLARLGHSITIFEARPEPGGMLTHGIPEFRLPKAVVEREIAALRALGVRVRVNEAIGETLTLDDLFTERGFEAVFLAAGASHPRLPDIRGTDLGGVFSAHDYLILARLLRASGLNDVGLPALGARRVTVIGGGDSAFDAARTAVRLGAAHVRVAYRHTRTEMPARQEEITFAGEEGVEMLFLAAPVEVLGDAGGQVRGVRFQEMQREGPGAFFTVETDHVVFATGGKIDPALRATSSLHFGASGHIVADWRSGATERKGVFAGGHVADGGATVSEAMGSGRRAAHAIHEYIEGPLPDGVA